VQPVVTFCTYYPYNRVIRSVGRCDPWGALAALTNLPSKDYGWGICRSNLVGLNLAAGAKNKIGSLRGRVGGRRLTPQSAIDT
jgi:hypothetical protein